MTLTKLARLALGAIVALCVSVSALAQNKQVTGKVTDAKDGSALPSVSVTVKGEKAGTQTGADGSFRINVSSNATLVFSIIGYEKKEVAVGSNTTINVSLAATNEQ